MTTPQMVNPVVLWCSISPPVQTRIGAMLIAYHIARHGAAANLPSPDATSLTRAMEFAETETDTALGALIEASLPLWFEIDPPCIPNLNPLGIRQCTDCGFPDGHGCGLGRIWGAPITCSNYGRDPSTPVHLRRLPFPIRFLRSYRLWRQYGLHPIHSIAAAWRICRS